MKAIIALMMAIPASAICAITPMIGAGRCCGASSGFNTEGVSASTPQNFSGIQSTYYWSSDEESETIAYAYHMGGGFSSLAYKTADLRGMAVNPEPVSSILFITGAATLGLSRRWRKRRNA